MFLNNRYLDAATGTFLSVDPLVASTGTPYLYGNGNPVTYSDPSGLEAGSWTASCAGADASCGNREFYESEYRRMSAEQRRARLEHARVMCGGGGGCDHSRDGNAYHEQMIALEPMVPGPDTYSGSRVGEAMMFGFLGGGLLSGVAPAAAGVAAIVRGTSLSFAVNFPRITSLLVGGARLGRDLADDNPGGGADDALRALAPAQQRAVRSLQQQVAEHTAKLEAYVLNPAAFDNLGILERAPTEAIRQSIVDGRIRHLTNEIQAFQGQIDRLLGGAG